MAEPVMHMDSGSTLSLALSGIIFESDSNSGNSEECKVSINISE